MDTFRKDPGEELDYPVDWSNRLETGEAITASTWTVPTGITELSKSFTGTIATIWLSGGTHGVAYRVTNKIETSQSRKREWSILIKVGDE